MKKPDKFFENLIHRHKAMIYSVCFMYASDRQEADDIFQEVLVNIWKGLPSLQHQGNSLSEKLGNDDDHVIKNDDDHVIKSWIYRIALNTCVSYKRKKRIKTEPLELAPQLFQQNTNVGRQTEALHKRITQLEPLDRAIVLLWLENMSYEEIGAIIGIETRNVGVRLIRIKEKLKKMNDNER